MVEAKSFDSEDYRYRDGFATSRIVVCTGQFVWDDFDEGFWISKTIPIWGNSNSI